MCGTRPLRASTYGQPRSRDLRASHQNEARNRELVFFSRSRTPICGRRKKTRGKTSATGRRPGTEPREASLQCQSHVVSIRQAEGQKAAAAASKVDKLDIFCLLLYMGQVSKKLTIEIPAQLSGI